MGDAAATSPRSAVARNVAGEAGGGPGLKRSKMPLSKAGPLGRLGASLASAYPSCALLGGYRALQADGESQGTQIPGALLAQAELVEAEEQAGGLLLPGCKMKRVSSGQVVARPVAWRRSGPSRLQATGASEFPTPLPPPTPQRSPSGLFLGCPASLAVGRDCEHLDRSAKKCSSNPGAGADTWCWGALCC